jgi:hypothetical protein
LATQNSVSQKPALQKGLEQRSVSQSAAVSPSLAFQIEPLQIQAMQILDLKIEDAQCKGYTPNTRSRIQKTELRRLNQRKNYISLANSLIQQYQFLKILQQFFLKIKEPGISARPFD